MTSLDPPTVVRVLFVGGPADGQWEHVAGVPIPDDPWARSAPATRWLDMERDCNVVRYAIHEVRDDRQIAWLAIPAHIHHPFDYLLSLYSTNALSAKKP